MAEFWTSYGLPLALIVAQSLAWTVPDLAKAYRTNELLLQPGAALGIIVRSKVTLFAAALIALLFCTHQRARRWWIAFASATDRSASWRW